MHNLLETMFNENDKVGKLKCSNRDWNQDQIDSTWENIIINPVLNGIKEENVTEYKNFLLEIDPNKEEWDKMSNEGRLSELKKQKEYFKDSGIPYSAIIYSGNKSLHILICLDRPLPSRAIWKFTRKWIQNILPEVDGNLSAVVGVRNPLNRRSDTGFKPVLIECVGKVRLKTLNAWISKYDNLKPAVDNTPDNNDICRSLLSKKRAMLGLGELKKRTKDFLNGIYHEGEWHTDFWIAANDLFGQGYSFEETKEQLRSVTGRLDHNDIYQLHRIYEKGEFAEYKTPFIPKNKWASYKDKPFLPKYKWE